MNLKIGVPQSVRTIYAPVAHSPGAQYSSHCSLAAAQSVRGSQRKNNDFERAIFHFSNHCTLL